MRGLVPPRRDWVHVDVKRLRSRRVEDEAFDPRLLARFPQGDDRPLSLPGLGMAAGLEPAIELPVMEQEHAVARRRDHDGAPREVALEDVAVERVRVSIEKRKHFRQIAGLLGVSGHMPLEPGAKARFARGLRGGGGFGAERRTVDTRDARAVLESAHDLLHGRAVGVRCQRHPPRHAPWHTQDVGLGRTTRFAPLPSGARRVSVMRAGAGGIKILAPSNELVAEFQARKRALVRAGAAPDAAHSAAHRDMGYRGRYIAELRARAGALPALRQLIAEARTGDVFLMCMCAYRTRGRACHTYALLDLARELDPSVRQLPEPAPRRPRAR
jgi:hypothetical protein